eukprot:1809863-Amphidinium_carterae.2
MDLWLSLLREAITRHCPKKILDAQVLVSPQHDLDSKKVMQVSLVLHRVKKLEVVQQAALLQIPTPQQFDVVLELYEEHCKDTVFSAWLKRGDLALILADSSSMLTPSATNNFRITGESPSRVIRRTGAVQKEHIQDSIQTSSST